MDIKNSYIKELVNMYGRNQYNLGFYVGFVSGAICASLFLIK